MLEYQSDEARSRAKLATVLQTLKAAGATTRPADDIMQDMKEHGAAILAMTPDGRAICSFNPQTVKPGQVLTLPNSPDDLDPKRALYVCPICKKPYLDRLPGQHRHTRPGDTLPGVTFVNPCPGCAATLKAEGIDFQVIDMADLEAEERRARQEARESDAARQFIHMTPASTSLN